LTGDLGLVFASSQGEPVNDVGQPGVEIIPVVSDKFRRLETGRRCWVRMV